MSGWARVVAALLCGVALTLGGGVAQTGAGPEGRDLPVWVEIPEWVYFPETGHHLGDPFLYHWRRNGGRQVFGLPVSEARTAADGQSTVQYFERAVLEHRPNTGGATTLVVGHDALTTSSLNLRTGPGTQYAKVRTLTRSARVRLIGGPLVDAAGAPWYQVAGDFGAGWSKGEFLERHDDAVRVVTEPLPPSRPRDNDPAFRPLPALVRGALGADGDDLTYFPSTGHTLANPFKRYWEANGGPFVFGLPISEPLMEINPDNGAPYLTQYFERARLERHPEAAGTDYEVQQAGVGRWAARAAGVPTAPAKRIAGMPDYHPDLFVGPKWIEVNLTEQRLTAWDGDLPVISTLIRSGKKGWESPPGTHRIFRKLPKDDMTLGSPGDEDYYYIHDVPWVMYFMEGGFAIHAADWLDVWGTPTSRGCINTPGEIAAAVYEWAPLGTIVWIHY